MLMVGHILLDFQVHPILLFVLLVVFAEAFHVLFVLLVGGGLHLQH